MKNKLLAFAFCVISVFAEAQSDVINTKHNLSVSGPGEIKALTENRICIFCHTPHNATPQSPLWNKELRPQVYDVYTSSTLKAQPLPQPTGPTKLCLSCHDGTIALGAVVNPAGGITMAGGNTFPAGSLSNFGLNLSSHHPVSFPYSSSLPNAELVPSPPANLVLGGDGEVHCTTCHDPHNDTYGKFLLMDNRFSALCTSCHQMNGWVGSAHATSTASVVGVLPIYPKTWPTWTQLNEWGCETCHTPHFAATAEGLLNFTDAPPTPFACTSAGCHSSEPGPIHTQSVPQPAIGRTLSPSGVMADIAGQLRKTSGHHEPPNFDPSARSSLTRAQRASIRAVSCADCHNPHVMNRREATAPDVPGLLQGVSGVDRNGTEVPSAKYEYEVCFKCHSDYTPDLNYVPRIISTTNTRLAFDPSNASYHPVVSVGKNLNSPSIPSTFKPTLNASNMIYCTDCHSDDAGGSKGPHGSSFPPILKARYETADNTPESNENYALCYQCHNRDSILSDVSFRKKALPITGTGGGHSGHLRAGIPCSACHDPHGVKDQDAGLSGSHTNLINFDTRIVQPKPGMQFPIFKDTGNFSGSCTLECHGVIHDNFSYP
jgi:predicted CXXCH cytochrome family protein